MGTDRVRLRAFSVSMRFHDGGKPDVSYVQEFSQPIPELVQKAMQDLAEKTNAANKARNLDATMEVRFSERLMEMKWTGADRDLVMLYILQELIQQTKDPQVVLRALMPRGPAKIEVRP